MGRTFFFIVCLVSILGLATPISAAILLASYEPSEVDCLTVVGRPDTVDVNWPLLGGVNDVPPATEGNYVLKLNWMGESHKVEIGHYWTCTQFDLAGVDYILVDVYFSNDTSIPGIIGIWDDIFGWVSAVCKPCTTGEWHTVLFYVGNLEHTGRDHIWAFLFEQLAADYGTIYVDNLRLGSAEDLIRREISFAGYNWMVKDSGCDKHGPGPNYFSHSKENVWVDGDGYLHMKTANRCDKWFCSEVILDASPGYGTYVFTTQGRVDLLDPNIVLGLFTWDTDAPHYNYREIDIEFSRWWDADEPNNAQYVIQPWNNPGNRHRFRIDCDGEEITTHEITWHADEICFRSYYGDYTCAPPPVDIIESWCYTGDDIPPAGGENARINFWLLPPKGDPWGTPKPTNEQGAEVVVKSFQYLPDLSAGIGIYPRTLNLASRGRWIMCLIKLDRDCKVADIEAGTVFLEDRVTADWVRSSGRSEVAVAKFSCPDVQEMLAELGELGSVELTVTGRLTDGTRFEGTDVVRVIEKGNRR